MWYWIKTNPIIKRFFNNYVWDLPNNQNKVYLTFDDGPTPKITEWVLEELQKHHAKATFFCIGKNIQKNPEILKKIIENGHAIGNHTYNHKNGWKTSTKSYLANIKLVETTSLDLKCKIFRPPYGKITPWQSRKLQKLGYQIIMWDVLSADFDTRISPEKCLENVISNLESGSIIVFHDSQKAFQNLQYTLPRTLNFLAEKGFVCERIVF
jgi:peptidoglycan/xylan/chitin deacetylase (PgdA/CDA1 family)